MCTNLDDSPNTQAKVLIDSRVGDVSFVKEYVDCNNEGIAEFTLPPLPQGTDKATITVSLSFVR